MSGGLTGLRCLVTGGGSGIAKAAALRYASDGATVTVLTRSEEGAAAVSARSNGEIRVLVGDATRREDLESAIQVASGEDGRLDHLTCGVGVFDHYQDIRELTSEQLLSAAQEIWSTNVTSALLAVNLASHALREARGSVTLTLSESAFLARGGGVLYGSSKWALRGVVKHLASLLAPDIRVNGVAPGGTSGTRFGGLESLDAGVRVDQIVGRNERIAGKTLLGRVATPEDHAGAYRFLADPSDARMITGVVIRSDGGCRV